MTHRIFVLIAVSISLLATACAQSLFTDTFQDGDMEGWRGKAGRGDIQLTEYAGNFSLRLTRDAWAGMTVAIAEADSYHISVDFAADNLEGRDGCALDYSADGADWIEIGRISDGQDDSITLVNVAGSVAGPIKQLAIRVRADGNAANDTCWADNLRVSAHAKSADMSSKSLVISPALLNSDTPLLAPLSASQFAPSDKALPADAQFRGQLSFEPALSSTETRVVFDRFGFEQGSDTPLGAIPQINAELVQSDGRLLPLKRGLILTDNPYWDYILTPGRVWQEPGDDDWTRAALPFALVEKNANCVHNGLLTFGFKADGTVTPAAWQIGSETCAYFQFDAWSKAAIEYRPGTVTGESDAIMRDAEEQTARLPISPLSALGAAYPGIDISAFGSPEDIAPGSMTTFGLVAEGVHYASDCETRYGPYPYCDELVIPSYSFAKSLFGGFGLMRLEKLYPGAMDAKISDYVPACAAAGTWSDVTFENALDMTTGHYTSTEPEADENAAVDQDFFILASHADKIRLACTQYPRRSTPGEVSVYHTSDTYLLGTAMQAFLREKMGPKADIYRDLLVTPIWKPLGLSATMDETRRTSKDDVAQPFTGWGLFMQRGDLAKLLQFIGANQGKIEGVSIFAPEQFAAALQRQPDDRGLPASAPPLGYNNGFWSFDIQSYGGCDKPIPVPFMSGFGGLAAAILPNGTAYYYVSDGGAYSWARAAMATETIAAFCKGSNQ